MPLTCSVLKAAVGIRNCKSPSYEGGSREKRTCCKGASIKYVHSVGGGGSFKSGHIVLELLREYADKGEEVKIAEIFPDDVLNGRPLTRGADEQEIREFHPRRWLLPKQEEEE